MIYPIYTAQISPPSELVCFVKLPDGRTQDLSYLCGDQPHKARSAGVGISPIADPPDYIPPNAVNSTPSDAQSSQPLLEEEDE